MNEGRVDVQILDANGDAQRREQADRLRATAPDIADDATRRRVHGDSTEIGPLVIQLQGIYSNLPSL